MNVAVEPAVERPELRANQDEGFGYAGSLQESVQIVHHPGRQNTAHLSLRRITKKKKQGTLQTGPGG